MQVISLFSGIGGFEIAAEWMGWDNVLSCEINPFGRRVLEYYWPNSYHHDDIKTLNIETIKKSRWNPESDTIICGGFPCQPYSLAGKRKGKEDKRHLWPEMLRTIREVQPTYVVGENVLGLLNWKGGLVFEEVQSDLEAEGYEVFTFVLPACAKDAPHRRDRVWVVAHASDKRCNNGSDNKQERCIQGNDGSATEDKPEWNGRKRRAGSFGSNVTNSNGNGQYRSNGKHEEYTSERRINALGNAFKVGEQATDTNGTRWEEQYTAEKPSKQDFNSGLILHSNSTSKPKQHIGQEREGKFNKSNSRIGINNWENFPTQPPICSGNDGIPDRLDGITFPKWRNKSIMAFGNAIVPQVAFEIFKAIQITHNK